MVQCRLMAVKSSGTIGLSADIIAEFGGDTPHSLSEYYRNAGIVGSTNTSVPTSGAISLSEFYSTSALSTGILSRSVNTVNEGSIVTFTLPVTGYSDGDTIPYTITGIQAADLSPASLSGNLVVSGSNAEKAITAVADQITEGNQTMTFSADNQSVNVTINDTSKTPSYSFTLSPSSVNEGSAATWTLTSTNHPGGNVTFTRSGATSDGTWSISSGNVNSGYFSVPAGNSTRTLTFTTTADNTTEGSETVSVTCKSITRTLTINDTSIAPPNAQGQLLTASTSQSSGASHYFYRWPNLGSTSSNDVVVAAAVSWRSNGENTIANAWFGSNVCTIIQENRGDSGAAIVYANYTSSANRLQVQFNSNIYGNYPDYCTAAIHRIVNTPTKFTDGDTQWNSGSNTRNVGFYTRTSGDKGFYLMVAGSSASNSSLSASTAGWSSNPGVTQANEYAVAAGSNGYGASILSSCYYNGSGGNGWLYNYAISWNPGGSSQGTLVGAVFS